MLMRTASQNAAIPLELRHFGMQCAFISHKNVVVPCPFRGTHVFATGTGVATADGATAPSEVTTLPGCTGCTEAANTVVDAMLGKGPEDAADAGVIGA